MSMALVVAGIDLSLTATGISCIFDLDGEVVIECTTFGRKGKRDEPVTARAERIATLSAQIRDVTNGAELAVIEGPSLGSIGGSTHDRSGLWWAVVGQLVSEGIPVAVAAPATRAKWATGNGNAKKPEVLACMRSRFPDVVLGNDNEADALALATLGMMWLERGLDSPTRAQMLTLASVQWPALAA